MPHAAGGRGGGVEWALQSLWLGAMEHNTAELLGGVIGDRGRGTRSKDWYSYMFWTATITDDETILSNIHYSLSTR